MINIMISIFSFKNYLTKKNHKHNDNIIENLFESKYCSIKCFHIQQLYI